MCRQVQPGTASGQVGFPTTAQACLPEIREVPTGRWIARSDFTGLHHHQNKTKKLSQDWAWANASL